MSIPVVYIVRDEDRIIHGVFSNRKAAEKCAAALEKQGLQIKIRRFVPAKDYL